MAIVSLIWLVLSFGMKKLKKSKSFSFATNISGDDKANEIAELLINMPGVIEATLMHDDVGHNSEKSAVVAYLKVDEKIVDLLAVKALLHQEA